MLNLRYTPYKQTFTTRDGGEYKLINKLINGKFPFEQTDFNKIFQFQNINDKSKIITGKLMKDDDGIPHSTLYVIEVEGNNHQRPGIYTY